MPKKAAKPGRQVIPLETIERRIYLIRHHKVMIDSDLAELYGVSTRRLNEQVERNRARFPLRIGGMRKQKKRERVRENARLLAIEELLDRYPRELSGGQRQRVAIGRAIVRRPKLFLFDEPLSNLDARLRVKMRAELAGLHRQLGTTIVYVTHDQVEAMCTHRSEIDPANA